MKKGTKTLLLYAGLGGLFWYFIQRGKTPPVPETAIAKSSAVELPTDSMLPGTMPAAVQGIVKEGEGLACIGCM